MAEGRITATIERTARARRLGPGPTGPRMTMPAPSSALTPTLMTGPGGRRSRRRALALMMAAGMTVGAGCAGSPGPTDEAAEGTTTTVRAEEGATTAPSTTAPATTEAPTTTAPPTTTTAPPETTTTVPPPTTTTAPPDPADDGMLELSESGESVSALQQRLVELGYWLGEPDGTYGQLTRQAVMAFQKAEGLGRDGTAGPRTRERLATAGRPTGRSTSGNLIEIDLERQLLLVIRNGQVQWALNTSTGSGEAYESSTGGTAVAATPPGTFTIGRQIDGLREAPLGTLYRPKYFNGGIAVHGSGSIPAQPASHGCARLTNSAMDLLWSSGVAEIGTTVWVY